MDNIDFKNKAIEVISQLDNSDIMYSELDNSFRINCSCISFNSQDKVMDELKHQEQYAIITSILKAFKLDFEYDGKNLKIEMLNYFNREKKEKNRSIEGQVSIGDILNEEEQNVIGL